jgi:hypothetical protein
MTDMTPTEDLNSVNVCASTRKACGESKRQPGSARLPERGRDGGEGVARMSQKQCCFCGDDLENHVGNIQNPGDANKWLCGTCVRYAELHLYLLEKEQRRQAVAAELAETERKATELATGIEEVTP